MPEDTTAPDTRGLPIVPEHPRFYLEPLGCAKNQVDAEQMISVLLAAGWRSSDDPADADFILVNTCGFILPAKEEAIETSLGFCRDYPATPVVLTGCLAQRYGGQLLEQMPELCGVFGNRDVSLIDEFLRRRLPSGERVFLPADAAESARVRRTRLLGYPGSAYVKISEGCRNACAFCAIPLIRGKLRSRPIPGIVAEFRDLLARGIKEVCLIAQDLASFGLDRRRSGNGGERLDAGRGGKTAPGDELVALTKTLLAEPGDYWLRLLYIYPESFPPALLELCRSDPRLLPYFDIPLQHSETEILRAMGRPGTGEQALSLIRGIRSALPDCMIRTSLIAGFPGETDAHAQALGEFLRTARVDWAGVFAYSREENTRAYAMKNRVPKRTAMLRKRALEEVQEPITGGRLARFIGTEQKILVEEIMPGEPPIALGRAWFQAPEVDGLTVVPSPPDGTVPGEWLSIRVESVSGVDITGRPV